MASLKSTSPRFPALQLDQGWPNRHGEISKPWQPSTQRQQKHVSAQRRHEETGRVPSAGHRREFYVIHFKLMLGNPLRMPVITPSESIAVAAAEYQGIGRPGSPPEIDQISQLIRNIFKAPSLSGPPQRQHHGTRSQGAFIPKC
jgi:hypothetical protein